MSETTNPTSSNIRYDSQTTGAPDETGENEQHSLRTYVSDLLALIKHSQVPLDRQISTGEDANYGNALALVKDIKNVLDAQQASLEAQLESLGGHKAEPVKSAWSSLLGAGAAAINTVRKTKISKGLRDDYTALGLMSISYTMLHATASGLGDTNVASLAERNLSQIAPLIIRISKDIPAVVLQELRDDGENVRIDAAQLSSQKTHEVWQSKS